MTSSSEPHDFGQRIHPVSVIKAILDGYPFGVGIFREFLQNSDDARASKQIFLLDYRHHPVHATYRDQLQQTQGPALIAYNNSVFKACDWEALQNIYQSSKKLDTSKIGKYGIGFRSCYHITDLPQILSDDSFVIFDPQNHFTHKGGLKIDLSEVPEDHRLSLNLNWFRSFSPPSGTIIRLPLRAEKSEIGKKVTPLEIEGMFDSFVNKEIGTVLLFLDNLKSIEIYTIKEGDKTPKLIAASHSKNLTPLTGHSGTWMRQIDSQVPGQAISTNLWRVLYRTFDESECSNILSARFGGDFKSAMAREKLTPEIALAISSPVLTVESGRLFTYLPLPLLTQFPCHIHGLFALDQSRQNLRNSNEIGLVSGSSDSIRVKWNCFLFDTLIPRAWCDLLSILVEQDNIPVEDFFRAWPNLPSDPSSAWHCVPMKLFEEIKSRGNAVWPILPYSPGHDHRFFSLHDVIVALDTDASNSALSAQLAALVATGLRITTLPHHIYSLMDGIADVTYLSPVSVRNALLDHTDELTRLSKENVDHVLSYLLSSNSLETILDFPLLTCVNGDRASLSKRSPEGTIHVLMDSQAQSVFSLLDSSAIALSLLPSVARNLLLQEGEHSYIGKSFSQGIKPYNTELLSCNTVIHYLRLAFPHFNISHLSSTSPIQGDVLDWFANFWTWLVSWSSKKQLYPSLKSLPTLPTLDGRLRSAQSGIFALGPDERLCETLQKIGVPFLYFSAHEPVRIYLREHFSLKSMSSVSDLLQHILPCNLALLDQSEIQCLRDHFVASDMNKLSIADIVLLRRLPLFRRLVPQVGDVYHIVHSLEPITNELDVKCVPEECILPVVPGVFYTSDLSLARLIDPNIQQLSEINIVRLAIDNFACQPEHLQFTFLSHLHRIRREIPPAMIEKLRRCRFVTVSDGSRSSPADIFDPTCPVAVLLLSSDRRLPSPDLMSGRVVDALRTLGLLNVDLTSDLIRERITFIAGRSQTEEIRMNIAGKLLDAVENTVWHSDLLSSSVNFAWLPTDQGLCSPSGCRDRRDQSLCQGVLPLLTDRREIRSAQLRAVLGWNNDLPLAVIVKRFKNILTDDNYSTSNLQDVINEFGRRLALDKHVLDEIFPELVNSAGNKHWIPVSGSLSELSPPMFAVFSPQDILPMFHMIHPGINNLSSKAFLEWMGCTKTPSKQAILRAIQSCEGSVEQIVVLLKALRVDQLSAEDLCMKFVPDLTGALHKPSDIFYNDLGRHKSNVSIPADTIFSHSDIDHNLASRLGIRFLSSLVIPEDDDEDMHEDLVERISGILRQYDKKQAFLEFLANAADAKATKFGIYLDETSAIDKDLLLITPAMIELQKGASLTIYNDGLFSEKDWTGIRKVGTGGKRDDNQDNGNITIGRFGLGALSMFHFTEVAMIISGDRVMFLDPTRNYIHGAKNRSIRTIPLATLNRLFPDHLRRLRGIFGFSDCDYYPGTLFHLPLRTQEQAKNQSTLISRDCYKAVDILNLLKDFYDRFAASALLFIDVRQIHAMRCSRRGQKSSLWSVEVTDRKSLGAIEKVAIRRSQTRSLERWNVLKEITVQSDVPQNHHAAMIKARIKHVVVGIAGFLPVEDNDCHEPNSHHVFFGVPTPTSTSLPVHVNGSFILSDDRRSVRFEDNGKGNQESLFNKWVLSEKVTSAYLHLMETWPHHQKIESSKWWPDVEPKDAISKIVVDAISDQFFSSHKLICESLTGLRVSPNNSVFLLRRGHVREVLQLLRPLNLAKAPPFIQDAVTNNKYQVNAFYLNKVLLEHKEQFRSLFLAEKISLEDVIGIVQYLAEEGNKELFIGLPLVPLADGDLAEFYEAGQECIYACSKRELPRSYWSFFGLNRSLHLDIDTQGANLMIQQSLNVSELTADAISRFLSFLPRSCGELVMTDEEGKRFGKLWPMLQALSINEADFADFPIVPTHSLQRDNACITYLSIKRCEQDDVIVLPPGGLDSIPSLELERIGAKFVICGLSCPVLQKSKSSDFSVLRFLDSIPEPEIHSRFSRLPKEEHIKLAQWITDTVPIVSSPGAGLSDFVPLLRRLPVWEVIRSSVTSSAESLAAARDIVMLPDWVEISVTKRFFSIYDTNLYANYSSRLSALGVKSTLNAGQFIHLLKFPHFMQPILSDYTLLLRACLTRCLTPYDRRLTQAMERRLLVPNENGSMVPPNTLYSYSESLFRDVFSTTEHKFLLLHRSLSIAELEPALEKLGLRYKLDFDSFEAVASVIHAEPDGPAKVEHAIRVYEAYNSRLYSFILGNASSWRQLDHLRFIPRNAARRQSANDTIGFDQFCQPLPMVVSPSQLLSAPFEPIAWTQRALFQYEPSVQLSLSNPALGKPTIGEVIQHLRVLSQDIAPLYVSNMQLIADLKATYSWLNEQADEPEIGVLFGYHHDKDLFLNVDDPITEWKWQRAQNLFFDVSDDDRRCVKGFLVDFKNLLLQVGAHQIERVTAPPIQPTPAEETLRSLREAFFAMRNDAKLTDIIFETAEGKELLAHRVFLAAQSDHFRDMFTGDFEEAMAPYVRIPRDRYEDFAASTLEIVLDYMYEGTIPANIGYDSLVDTMEASHYFDLEDLNKRVQVELINRHLTPWTHGSLLELAQKFQDEAVLLTTACQKFAAVNSGVLGSLGLSESDSCFE